MDQLTIYENLARQEKLAREHFLKDREKRLVQDEMIYAQTAPIVEAIKASKVLKPLADPLLTADLKRILVDLQNRHIGELKRNSYIKVVQDMYRDEPLFNTFLTLTKDGVYEPPIAKVKKYGAIESLIFYGQGGTNLDMAPVKMQTLDFKDRLISFKKFYDQNSKSIWTMVTTEKKDQPNQEEEMSDWEEEMSDWELSDHEQDMPDLEEDDAVANQLSSTTVYEPASDESLVPHTGEGLKERLSILHASKNAGNTSLDIVNEAHDILKMLLKKGEITKASYSELEKLF